jgi:hypothetical protein
MVSTLRLLLGFICGVAATGPMSAIMVAIHRRLPAGERYPLPPREITMKAIERVPGGREIDPATRSALTWLAHFGYGGAAGALYAGANAVAVGSQKSTERGLLFGLLVWAVSYLGLLPGLGVLKPVTEHPVRRSGLMIVAHLAWGLILAGLYEVFTSDIGQEKAAFHGSLQPNRDRV